MIYQLRPYQHKIEEKEIVLRLLVAAGIGRNSGNFAEYEYAKMFFQKQKLTPEEYERRIRIAAKYIGI